VADCVLGYLTHLGHCPFYCCHLLHGALQSVLRLPSCTCMLTDSDPLPGVLGELSIVKDSDVL
jgi:hypothetical protein